MALDISKLTLGEVATIEDLCGEKFSTAFADGEPSAKAMAAVGLIAKRREQLAQGQTPNFSWNEAQELTFEDVNTLLGVNDQDADAAPKDEPEPSKTSSRKKS